MTPENRGRHEIKYVAPATGAAALEALLATCCDPDPEYPDNVIYTVYFDSRGMQALAEKQNGDYIKQKVRLRWYGDSPDGRVGEGQVPAWLETKSREGASGWKTRISLRLPSGAVHPGSFSTGAIAGAVAGHVPQTLSPAVWLRYRRRRLVFADGVHRVSIDEDIAGLWLREDMPCLPHTAALPFTIVEVKGPERDIPHLHGLIGRFARKSAFSKYEMCVRYLSGDLCDA